MVRVTVGFPWALCLRCAFPIRPQQRPRLLRCNPPRSLWKPTPVFGLQRVTTWPPTPFCTSPTRVACGMWMRRSPVYCLTGLALPPNPSLRQLPGLSPSSTRFRSPSLRYTRLPPMCSLCSPRTLRLTIMVAARKAGAHPTISSRHQKGLRTQAATTPASFCRLVA